MSVVAAGARCSIGTVHSQRYPAHPCAAIHIVTAAPARRRPVLDIRRHVTAATTASTAPLEVTWHDSRQAQGQQEPLQQQAQGLQGQSTEERGAWQEGEDQVPPSAPWSPPPDRHGVFDPSGRLVVKCLTLPELEGWLGAHGEPAPARRALQLWRWMYADPPAGAWVAALEETRGRQNGFSAAFIEKFSPLMSLSGGLRLLRVLRAADGTRKLQFEVACGPAAGGAVEAVVIPVVRQAGRRDRLTLCVSSQVGCAMNCQFCFTGRMGLRGQLSAAQIVEQVVAARRLLAEEGERTPLTNLVFMGMGEPLHNPAAVLAAADIASHYLGLHISSNKITVSTVGLVPELRWLVARSRVQVALSLHATTDEVRDWIVPVNRRYDLACLTAALEELFPRLQPLQPPCKTQASLPTPHPQPHSQHSQPAPLPQPPAVEGQQRQQAQPHGTGTSSSGCCGGGGCGQLRESSSMGTAGQEPREQGSQDGGVSCCGNRQQQRQQEQPGLQLREGEGLADVPGRGRASAAAAAVAAEGPLEERWLPPLGHGESSSTGNMDGGTSSGSNNESATSSSSPLPPSPADASAAAAATTLGSGSSSASTGARNSVDNCTAVNSSNGGSSTSTSGSSGSSQPRSLLVGYTMLHGINDTAEDAQRLASMLSRVQCKVNLIVFNPHSGTRFQPSTPEDVAAFRSHLISRGLVCTIRDSRGDDEMAACGQLGNVGQALRPASILEPPERFKRFLLPPPTQQI